MRALFWLLSVSLCAAVVAWLWLSVKVDTVRLAIEEVRDDDEG